MAEMPTGQLAIAGGSGPLILTSIGSDSAPPLSASAPARASTTGAVPITCPNCRSIGSSAETSAAAPAQTKTEACALVENELKSFIAEQTSSSAPADPAARAKLVGEFTDRLDAALPKVTNDDVHDAFEDFTEDAKEYASALTSSGSSDSAEAKDAQTDVQSSLNEVSAVCPSN